MSLRDLEGKIAFVTGGSRGIGRACCQVLAREGARVVVTDINLQSAQHTLTLLPGPQPHLSLPLDVSSSADVVSAFKSARNHYNAPPSLLINCAGAVSPHAAFYEMEEHVFTNLIDINLKGTFMVSQEFVRALLQRGKAKERTGGNAVGRARGGEPEVETGTGGKAEGEVEACGKAAAAGEAAGGGETTTKGAIVNISSIIAKTGIAEYINYAASNGGVNALTKSLAAELARQGVRVNAVMPGPINTPMYASLPEEIYNKIIAASPIGRIGEPEEVAEVVVWLLSDRASYVVGALVEVTGGYSM